MPEPSPFLLLGEAPNPATERDPSLWLLPDSTGVGEDRFGHATPKPVAMIARAIRSSCPDGGLVLDPFVKTGTAIAAAEQLGRRCAGLEIEPRYCDVAVRRWEALTGRKAEREAADA